jgi:SAM-dependent methyltransferase
MPSPRRNAERISFDFSATAWNFPHWVGDLIRERKARSVCEIGGGANPLLSGELVAAERLEYVVADASPDELRKAQGTHRIVEVEVGAADFVPFGRFDVVVTKMVLEHVREPRRFHSHVFELLHPGGTAVHFFATLYALPFVANRVLPERLVQRLLLRLQPGRIAEGRERKFPAYYRWCRGPVERQFERFESVGFTVDEYVGFFGHGCYHPVPRLQRLEDRWSKFLVTHPVPWLTSFAWVRLRRPP